MPRPLPAQLPPRKRTILALRFFREFTQTQIAEQISLSQMHVPPSAASNTQLFTRRHVRATLICCLTGGLHRVASLVHVEGAPRPTMTAASAMHIIASQ